MSNDPNQTPPPWHPDYESPTPEPLPRNVVDMPLAVLKVCGMILVCLVVWRVGRG